MLPWQQKVAFAYRKMQNSKELTNVSRGVNSVPFLKVWSEVMPDGTKEDTERAQDLLQLFKYNSTFHSF